MVGAIIGELPVGSRFGMGVVIINAAQYYNWRPANLWAAILVSALLGIAFYQPWPPSSGAACAGSRSEATA